MKFERKFGLSEIISGLALILAAIAIWQSGIARDDVRTLNKLDLRPKLLLDAHLKRINESIPAHINIKNEGPVDAIQVQMQFYFLMTYPTSLFIIRVLLQIKEDYYGPLLVYTCYQFIGECWLRLLTNKTPSSLCKKWGLGIYYSTLGKGLTNIGRYFCNLNRNDSFVNDLFEESY